MCPQATHEHATTTRSGFDDAVEAYRQALASFVKGDPKPALEFYSRRDDVTLANPLGPPRVGFADVAAAAAEGASMLRDGTLLGFRGGVSIQHSRPWLRRPDREDAGPVARKRGHGAHRAAGHHDHATRGRHLEGRTPPRRPDHDPATDQHRRRAIGFSSSWPGTLCAGSSGGRGSRVARQRSHMPRSRPS